MTNDDNRDRMWFSELFFSIQGEGTYTGVPTVWLRVFGCNFQCNGFGQKDPTDPSTYQLPYKNVNPDDYSRLEDLPVFERGCDSSYSWDSRFRKLAHSGTPKQVAQQLIEKNKTDTNPKGLFIHPVTGNPIHICFTGGEPLMPGHQRSIASILQHITATVGVIPSITFETNTTFFIVDELEETFESLIARGLLKEVFFSCSPKLFNVSGEKNRIKPKVGKHYYNLWQGMEVAQSNVSGHLKFVVRNTEQCWNELQDAVDNFRAAGVKWPVWLMNCGGTAEGQSGELDSHNDEKAIAEKALHLGYNYSSRVHIHVWGNSIGT